MVVFTQLIAHLSILLASSLIIMSNWLIFHGPIIIIYLSSTNQILNITNQPKRLFILIFYLKPMRLYCKNHKRDKNKEIFDLYYFHGNGNDWYRLKNQYQYQYLKRQYDDDL